STAASSRQPVITTATIQASGALTAGDYSSRLQAGRRHRAVEPGVGLVELRERPDRERQASLGVGLVHARDAEVGHARDHQRGLIGAAVASTALDEAHERLDIAGARIEPRRPEVPQVDDRRAIRRLSVELRERLTSVVEGQRADDANGDEAGGLVDVPGDRHAVVWATITRPRVDSSGVARAASW